MLKLFDLSRVNHQMKIEFTKMEFTRFIKNTGNRMMLRKQIKSNNKNFNVLSSEWKYEILALYIIWDEAKLFLRIFRRIPG